MTQIKFEGAGAAAPQFTLALNAHRDAHATANA
jgi:hypothetical protein